MFPEAQFEYRYEETGMCFCGCEIYKNGYAQHIMEADLVEYFISDDEDDNTGKIDDYKEGREEETITVLGVVDGVKRCRIERREDRDNYVRFIKGVFIERIDDKLGFAACA